MVMGRSERDRSFLARHPAFSQEQRIPMRSWFRRSSRTKQSYNHGPRKYRPVVEGLEDRFLLAAPVISDLAFAANVPINKTLILPVSATDSQGGAITYTLTSSDNRVTITPLTG